MAECVDYPDQLNTQKTKKAVVSEYKVELNHDGQVIDQPPSVQFTFSTEQIAKQKTDLVSALENSESSHNDNRSAVNPVQQRDQTLNKTVDESDFHNRRKHRLSVRYLPNVQQMIQRYEKPAVNVPPPSVSSVAPVKQCTRNQASESSESLVARQAARYMSLDRNARLDINFENRQGSNGRTTCDNRKQTEQREHTLLSNCSSNSSGISSTSVFLGTVDISAIDSTCDLQLSNNPG